MNPQQPSPMNQQLTAQQELRGLLDSNIPEQIANIEESSANLERVAAYCEANYIQVCFLDFCLHMKSNVEQ